METQAIEPIEPGDILFYASSGTVFDRAIVWWTHPILAIVHVAIATSPRIQIEAQSYGIVSDAIASPVAVWHLREHSHNYDVVSLHDALQWLENMVGKPYGWSDILTALRSVAGAVVPFYIVEPGHYDCSALATEFLAKCGGVNLQGLDLDPHTVTPGALARQLGISEAPEGEAS